MYGAADARTLLDPVHDCAVLVPANDDVVLPALLVEAAGPAVAGALDDDDPADAVPRLVRVVDE